MLTWNTKLRITFIVLICICALFVSLMVLEHDVESNNPHFKSQLASSQKPEIRKVKINTERITFSTQGEKRISNDLEDRLHYLHRESSKFHICVLVKDRVDIFAKTFSALLKATNAEYAHVSVYQVRNYIR